MKSLLSVAVTLIGIIFACFIMPAIKLGWITVVAGVFLLLIFVVPFHVGGFVIALLEQKK